MKRSFFKFNENSDNVINNKKILEADHVIISAISLLKIMNNKDFDKEIINNLYSNRKVYLKIGFYNYKETIAILKKNNFSYIAGFYLENVEPQFINKMTDYARCFEKDFKLNFGSLTFIGEVSTPKGVVDIRKIANYDRISLLTFDANKFKEYTCTKFIDAKFYYNKILEYAFYYKKFILLNGVNNINEYKNLGVIGAITSDIEDVPIINTNFTPSDKEINDADGYINHYLQNQKQHSQFQDPMFSINKLLYYNLILERSAILNKDYKGNGFSLINSSAVLLKTKKQEISKFYTFGEELGNSITHGLGIIAGVVFLILLMFKLKDNFSTTSFVAYLVYSFSVLILYTSSFTYHLLPLGSKAKTIFQRFDHMTIYLLIAGSYTPYALIALGGTTGAILFIVIWFGALSGLILNLFWFGKFRGFHIFLYLLLGWAAVFFIVPIIKSLGTIGTILLFAGGISYTIGILFYGFKLFKFTHMVWHIFVLLGTILHFLSIYLFL